MSEIENYEAGVGLVLYREYRDVISIFRYVVETEHRFYPANDIDVHVRASSGREVFFKVNLSDVWVWDIHRTSHFIRSVRTVTFRDVNIEELSKADITRELNLLHGRCAAGLIHGWPAGLPYDPRAAAGCAAYVKLAGGRTSVCWHGLRRLRTTECRLACGRKQ